MFKNKLSAYYRAFVRIPRLLLRTVPESSLKDLGDLRQDLEKFAEKARFAEWHGQTRIVDVFLAEVFGDGIDRVSVPFGAIDEETGKMNAAELLYVSTVARHMKAKRIFEFGTFLGRTTYHLTYATESTTVTTLNLPPGPGVTVHLGGYYKGTERETRIRQILQDSKEFDPTPFAKGIDFIFVDGDHSYEGVKNDTDKAFHMLAPGGVIMWHDYGPSQDLGLVRFFVEFTRERPLFRIKKTSLLLHIDGVDPLTFQKYPMRKR
jgi:hypothetical protein